MIRAFIIRAIGLTPTKQVTLSELREWLSGSGGWDEGEVGELMELLDINHDGAITQEEYIEAMSNRSGRAVVQVII